MCVSHRRIENWPKNVQSTQNKTKAAILALCVCDKLNYNCNNLFKLGNLACKMMHSVLNTSMKSPKR